MKKILITVILSLFLGSATFGQQPAKVTEKWFAEPEDVKMDNPLFEKKSGFTTHEEMMEYISEKAAKYPDIISVEIVGKTQKGRDIPLVRVIKRDDNKNKLRVLYFARIHGDEPSGTEGLLYFISQLAENKDVATLLDKIDFYILPMVNADGGEKNERRTINGIDLNRDQSKLDTPEAVALHKVANMVKQDISIDFHEYQPVKRQYAEMCSKNLLSVPWDIMFLYSANPNVPLVIREVVDSLFIPQLGKAMEANGLTYHTYFTPKDDSENVIFNLGGSSPRSTSNAMALRNSISLLMETRGIGLGRTSILRRSNTVFIAALAVAKSAYENENLVREVIQKAISDRGDIAVKFSAPKDDAFPMKFLDLLKNDTMTINVRASLGYKQNVTKSSPLPDYYYILPSQTQVKELLNKFGIEYTTLNTPETMSAQCFIVTKSRTETEEVGGVLPVTVTTKMETKEVNFPAGTIVVSTNQRNVRSATVLLEPESTSGFVNFRVIDSELNKELPIYRVNK